MSLFALGFIAGGAVAISPVAIVSLIEHLQKKVKKSGGGDKGNCMIYKHSEFIELNRSIIMRIWSLCDIIIDNKLLNYAEIVTLLDKIANKVYFCSNAMKIIEKELANKSNKGQYIDMIDRLIAKNISKMQEISTELKSPKNYYVKESFEKVQRIAEKHDKNISEHNVDLNKIYGMIIKR